MSVLRRTVIWFGDAPAAETERAFTERMLILSHASAPITAATWASATGAVFALPVGDDGRDFESQWGAALREALLHGLRVIFLTDLEQIPAILQRVRHMTPDPDVRLRDHEKDIPETIARYDVGPSWSGTVEVEGDQKLNEEEKLLVRRAFGDCLSVKLIAQTEGRSARVFCGYARLKDSRAGPMPLPFFVKLDKRHKIERELTNYRECTTLFIPFNQRPNLDPQRCAIGLARGVIVGNFIEESVPLRQVVELGMARQPIQSLFGGALRGWRSQAHYDVPNAIRTSLIDSLAQCLPSRYSPGRRKSLEANAKAAQALGATTSPEELEILLRQLPTEVHRCALMHGDLHGENVRVSGTEAILIDFTSVGTGPLVADPAALDVALVMDTDTLSGQAWQDFAHKCYCIEHLITCPPPSDPTERTAALWNSIRLIRQIGLTDQMSEHEYATAIAIYLLRRASCRPDRNEHPLRREMAYLLAERLTIKLRDSATATSPGATEPLPAATA